MGSSLPKLFHSSKEYRVLMIGIAGAGKTTILYKLKLGEVVTTIPTIGFNVETVKHNNIDFTVWDVGGRGRMKALIRHYYQNTQGIICVVDSADRQLFEETKDMLDTLIDDVLSSWKDNDGTWDPNLAVVVLCNKQDLPNAMTSEEVALGLDLGRFTNFPWYVQSACATSGDGLHEGLDWLSEALDQGLDVRDIHTVDGRPVNAGNDTGSANAASSAAAVGSNTSGDSHGDRPAGGSNDGQPVAPTLIQNAITRGGSNQTAAFDERKVSVYGTTMRAVFDNQGQVMVNALNDMTDDEVVTAFEAAAAAFGELGDQAAVDWTRFSHDATIRLMYILLSGIEDRTAGRKAAVDKIFELLDGVKRGRHGFFHVTHTYFYIQLTDLALHLPDELEQVPDHVDGGSGSDDAGSGNTGSDNAELDAFRAFLTRRLYLLNEDLIGYYYSDELVFNDPQSMEEFVLPDKKPLPSVIDFNIGRSG